MSRVLLSAAIVVVLSACQDAEITAVNPPAFDRLPAALTGRIAFDRYWPLQDTQGGIYVMQLPGGTETKVFPDAGGCAVTPSWAPDGETIAYRGHCGFGVDGELFLGNVVTKATQQITFNGVHDIAPAWSPTGSALAFVRTVRGNHEIFIHTFGSLADAQVTSTPDLEFDPAWSPDGTRLAFERWNSLTQSIVIRDLVSGAETVIDHASNVRHEDPAWSPDGSKIALVRWELGNDGGQNYAVLVYELATLTVVDSISASRVRSPAWSPAGDALVFSQRSYNGFHKYWSFDLFVVTLASHKMKQLTNTPGDEDNPDWTQ